LAASAFAAITPAPLPPPLPPRLPPPGVAPPGQWCRAVVVRPAMRGLPGDSNGHTLDRDSRDGRDGNGDSSGAAAARARADLAVLLHYLAEVHGPTECTV
jgi:hypothetical protein